MSEIDPSQVVEFCEELVGRMELELSIAASVSVENLVINLSGPDRPVLLGGGAAVLNAIEYLVNKVFRSGREEKGEAIVLDSDSYRQHREAELVLLAQMASKSVRSQLRPMSLQPMSPKERRIVHLALAAIDGVRSESQGEGDSRSITIFPS
jgi:spoIIIJ-associated protein